MRIKFTKRLLFFCFAFLAISSISYAALIRSTGTGNWNDAIWEDENGVPATPQDGDEIVIDVGHTVTLTSLITLNNVTIAVRGTLRFYRQWFPPIIPIYGQLVLDATSTVVVETGGSILSDSFLDFNNVIEIDGTTQWNGGSGTLSGPSYIDTGGVTTGGTPPGYIPLPIELISFNAKLSGSVVEIDWATATELNNDFFTIERSLDGVEWSIIGEPEGAGDSHVRLDYQFIDYNPMPGLSYYRLKQTDFDGQFEYFSPSVVLYEPANLFKVFPNPVADVLNLTTSSNLENAAIVIKNLNGQQEQVITTVNSHQAQMDVQNLPPGIYVLEIIFNESTLTKRILKK